MGGPGESRLGGFAVALGLAEADVVGGLVPKQRGPGGAGLAWRYQGRPGAVVDADQLRRIAGLVPGLCHHQGDPIADEAHPLGLQQRVRWNEGPPALAVGRHHQAIDASQPLGRQFGTAGDQQHPGALAGGAQVEIEDIGVAVGRAQQHGVGDGGEFQIVEEAFPAEQKAPILEPGQRSANAGTGVLIIHTKLPVSAAAVTLVVEDSVYRGERKAMAVQVMRLLEDRLEAAVSGLSLGPAKRIFYCASGQISVGGATLADNQAHFSADSCQLGAGQAGAHVLRFELAAAGDEELLPGVASRLKFAQEIELDGGEEYLMRCDRIDFPPGAASPSVTPTSGRASAAC